MFTPFRPAAKRKLQWTTPRPAIRFRPNPTTQVRRFNKTKVAGPSKAGTLTSQVKALQKFANKFKPEKKFKEVSLGLANIVAGTGGIVNLVPVAEGTGEDERIGFVINVTDIKISLNIPGGASLTPASSGAWVRYALVVDKEQVADTNPTCANVFSGADVGAFPTSQFLERFRILYVSPIMDGNMATPAAGVPTRTNRWHYTFTGDVKVQYNGAATTDIEKNGIYLCILLTGFGNTLDTDGTARIAFTDV